jgi:hypothetical protein
LQHIFRDTTLDFQANIEVKEHAGLVVAAVGIDGANQQADLVCCSTWET